MDSYLKQFHSLLRSGLKIITMKDFCPLLTVENVVSNPKLLSKRVIQQMPRKLDKTSFRDLLKEIDTFIFDADGVLWLGADALPGSPEFLHQIIDAGKQVIVLTNNATKSRANYAIKLHQLGFPTSIKAHDIVNPAAVVAEELCRAGLANSEKRVYLIGARGVREEMDARGVQYFGHGSEPSTSHLDGSAFQFDLDLPVCPTKVGAVVVGYERHFDYQKLMKAANYLQDDQTHFFATNEDEVCPGPDPNIVTPDAGPIVAAVRCASGREPTTVGKPCTPSFAYICRRWSIDPKRTIMFGDRTNTDVLFGRRHGLRTCLVLSGCHQLEDVCENLTSGSMLQVPEFYAKCLGDLRM